MIIKNLPEKYQTLWEECEPLLANARLGDDVHAAEVVDLVLNYQGELKFDPDVLVPVAMMHDIGHSAILPEHFKYITGQEKLVNGKLVHMLAGAKVAKDLLKQVGYDTDKIVEIVDIVSMHDADQLKIDDWRSWYDTENKKVFHDLDALDRYTESRLKFFVKSGLYDTEEMVPLLAKLTENFFYEEFRNIAKEGLAKINKVDL